MHVALAQGEILMVHIFMCIGKLISHSPHTPSLKGQWKNKKLKSNLLCRDLSCLSTNNQYYLLLYSFWVQTLSSTCQAIKSSQHRIKSKPHASLLWRPGVHWFPSQYAFSFHVPGNRFSCHHLQPWVSNTKGYLPSWSSQSQNSDVLRLLRDFLERI